MANKSIVNFVYSSPYEGTLLRISGQKLTKKHSQETIKKVEIVQKDWNKYESKILKLFKEIYKIDIPEKYIKIYISQVTPNSYSDPLTISLKRWQNIENSERSKRGVVYSTIHELAHYFAYTRGDKELFNKLHKKIQKSNLLGSHGANLHYLIQAVEFGIVGEVFGTNYAEFSRNWVIENWVQSEYGKSAKELKDNNIPLNKECLKFIDEKILLQK